jgi:hypothetical protein
LDKKILRMPSQGFLKKYTEFLYTEFYGSTLIFIQM